MGKLNKNPLRNFSVIPVGLRDYTVRRLLIACPTLIGIMATVFLIVHSAPGNPITNVLGMRPGIDFPLKDMQRIIEQYGLNRPLYIQFIDWLSDLSRGHLGYSYVYNKPVNSLILTAARNTLILQGASFGLSLALAIPAGVIAASKQYSKADYATSIFSSFFWAMPSFWLGLELMLIFGVHLKILPTSGLAPPGQQPTIFSVMRHLILPALTQGLHGTAFLARLTRANMLEVLRQDYITTARAKGLKERIVIYRHALRNALLPVTTLIGVYVGWLIGGSVMIEPVFSWPGIGMLVVDAAKFRDYPLVMGVTLVAAFSMVIATLVTDIVYAMLDPRIKY